MSLNTKVETQNLASSMNTMVFTEYIRFLIVEY